MLAPVLTGIALNGFFPSAVARIAPYAPPVAVVMVALTCATVMAQAAASVQQAGFFLIAAVASLHIGGFALGYGVSKILRLEETTSRTNSIEVGLAASPCCLAPLALSIVVHGRLSACCVPYACCPPVAHTRRLCRLACRTAR